MRHDHKNYKPTTALARSQNRMMIMEIWNLQRFCSLHSDLATPHKETLYSSQQGEGICVGVCRHAAKE